MHIVSQPACCGGGDSLWREPASSGAPPRNSTELAEVAGVREDTYNTRETSKVPYFHILVKL